MFVHLGPVVDNKSSLTEDEVTARNFINPFMHKAVAMLKKGLRLAVEADFDGSRGYGFLDYVIF